MATVRIQVRRGTASQWTSANPILAAGELGVESDTNLFKFGNGSSTWTALAYANNSDVAIGEISQDAINTALTMGSGLTKTYNDGANTITIAVDSAVVATKTYTDTAIETHSNDTTAVHGITDTSLLVTTTAAQTVSNKTLGTDLSANGFKIVGLAAPTGNLDAATKSYVDTAISDLVEAAPATLNTLNELAAALGDDAAFSTTITNSIATKLPLAGGTMSGNLSMGGTNTVTNIPTPVNVGDVTSKAYVDGLAASTRTDAEATAASALSTHTADTTNVHGIADTSLLATTANVATAKSEAISAAGTAADTKINDHNVETINVHGIANTALLATISNVAQAVTDANNYADGLSGDYDPAGSALSRYNDAVAYADGLAVNYATAASTAQEVTDRNSAISAAIGTHTSDTTAVHGIADTSLLATTANVATAKSEAIDAAAVASENYTDAAVSALTKSSVGLGNVDNTADASKPVSTAQATAIATAKSEAIADATSQINAVIASAPAALNTLDELAAALGDDANFASTVTTSLAAKAPLASPTFTGTLTVSASGIAFTDGTQTKEGVPSRTVIGTTIGAAYNLSTGGLGLRDQLIPVSGAYTITVPTNATTAYPIGTSISFYQSAGADAVFAEAAGVTILRTPGLKLRALYSSATITKVSTDVWLLAGDLKA